MFVFIAAYCKKQNIDVNIREAILSMFNKEWTKELGIAQRWSGWNWSLTPRKPRGLQQIPNVDTMTKREFIKYIRDTHQSKFTIVKTGMSMSAVYIKYTNDQEDTSVTVDVYGDYLKDRNDGGAKYDYVKQESTEQRKVYRKNIDFIKDTNEFVLKSDLKRHFRMHVGRYEELKTLKEQLSLDDEVSCELQTNFDKNRSYSSLS